MRHRLLCKGRSDRQGKLYRYSNAAVGGSEMYVYKNIVYVKDTVDVDFIENFYTS